MSQAPFAYLNERYHGKLGVLWLDAHPDVSTPDMHMHEHAMVLGNLLGEGDKEFADKVKVKIDPKLVMYAGLEEMTPEEDKIVTRLNLRKASKEELHGTSNPVLQWIQENQIEHLAIHFDLDVLDPESFRALLFGEPGGSKIEASRGRMTFSQVSRLIQDVSNQTDVVGFAIAEHFPWDANNLHNFLCSIPIFK